MKCYLLALLLLFSFYASLADCITKMKVIKIIGTDEKGYIIVSFTPSARLYKLPENTEHFKRYLRLLKKSEAKNIPVTIRIESVQSDIILSVGK